MINAIVKMSLCEVIVGGSLILLICKNSKIKPVFNGHQTD